MDTAIILSLISIFLIVIFLIYNNINIKDNNDTLTNKLVKLDIMFMKLSTCPYCIKMESYLLENNLLNYVTIIDVKTPNGRELANQYNCKGFPSFISRKTGRMTSGYTEDMERLINDLE